MNYHQMREELKNYYYNEVNDASAKFRVFCEDILELCLYSLYSIILLVYASM